MYPGDRPSQWKIQAACGRLPELCHFLGSVVCGAGTQDPEGRGPQDDKDSRRRRLTVLVFDGEHVEHATSVPPKTRPSSYPEIDAIRIPESLFVGQRVNGVFL